VSESDIVRETMPTEDIAEFAFRLHHGQAQAYRSTARIIVVLAGSQGGKTSFTPIWLDKEIAECGPGDYLAASATFDLLSLKLLPEMREHFVRRLGWEYKASARTIINEREGKRIILRSGENPESLESATANAVVLDEFGQRRVPRESFEAARRRLTLRRGRILITTTAYYTEGWLIDLINSAPASKGQVEVIQFPSYYNPRFSAAEWYEQKKFLPPWKFGMMFEGRITRPPAQILCDFRPWDRSITKPCEECKDCMHGRKCERTRFGQLVTPFEIPKDWDRIVGVDFGLVNTAIVWIAHNRHYIPGSLSTLHGGPQSEYYVYRASLGGGITQEEWARKSLEYKEPVAMWLGGAPSENNHRQSWQMGGVGMIEPLISGDVEARLDHLIGIIRQDRMAVFDHLADLRTQAHTYSREMDTGTNEPTDKINDKQKYHLIDAWGYGATAIPRKADVYEPPPQLSPDPRIAAIEALEAEHDERPDFDSDAASMLDDYAGGIDDFFE